MDNVQFEETNEMKAFTSRKIFGDPTTPKMAKALMKMKLVKNTQQAEYLMIAIIITCLLISAYSLSRVFAPGLLPF